MTVRVAVIGGGVVGLAAASELMRAGAEVRCYEKTGAGSAQSKGMTRIFRLAHGDARLVELAMRARNCWCQWEEQFGRRLIGREGLIITGKEIVSEWSEAMLAAQAPCELLSEEAWKRRLPIATMPDAPVLFDPAGGATRAHRTIELLRQDVADRLRIEEVSRIESNGDGCVVHAAAGRWQCDEVVIAAGVDSAPLARQVGLELPVPLLLHSRFTFEVRPEYRDVALSCWIDDSGLVGPGYRAYCQPVGTTRRYAVGVGWDDEDCSLEVGAETENRESRGAACRYVRETLPGLKPEPVSDIQCISGEYAFSTHGDGFMAGRGERVTAVYGSNLFKFAPLLGQLLTHSVMHGRLPAELELFSGS